MKNISKLILGMVFVFGMTSMSGVDSSEKTNETVILKRIPCETVHTVCDNHAPDDYWDFLHCMESNGCA